MADPALPRSSVTKVAPLPPSFPTRERRQQQQRRALKWLLFPRCKAATFVQLDNPHNPFRCLVHVSAEKCDPSQSVPPGPV